MSITFHGRAADFNSTANAAAKPDRQNIHLLVSPQPIYWAQGARSLVLSFCRFWRSLPLTIDYAPLYSNNEGGKTSKRLPAPSSELSFVNSCAVHGRQARAARQVSTLDFQEDHKTLFSLALVRSSDGLFNLGIAKDLPFFFCQELAGYVTCDVEVFCRACCGRNDGCRHLLFYLLNKLLPCCCI